MLHSLSPENLSPDICSISVIPILSTYLFPSTLKKGYPYDNAPMESFHASLKKEAFFFFW